MKKLMVLGLALAAWAGFSGAASAQDPGCGCCGAGGRYTFHAQVTERPCTVEKWVPSPYLVKVRETVQNVPCTRLVPVCVTDPCTGCTRTELQQQTVVEKVKTKCYDILPPEKPCTLKKEVKVEHCVTITLDVLGGGCCCQ